MRLRCRIGIHKYKNPKWKYVKDIPLRWLPEFSMKEIRTECAYCGKQKVKIKY